MSNQHEHRLLMGALQLRAAEYVASMGESGGNIDGDPGGIDHERIAPFADYLPEALVAAGFRLRVTFDNDLRRLITTAYKPKETT